MRPIRVLSVGRLARLRVGLDRGPGAASGVFPLLLHPVVVFRAHLVSGEARRRIEGVDADPSSTCRLRPMESRLLSTVVRPRRPLPPLDLPPRISATTATKAIIRRPVNLGRVRRMARFRKMTTVDHRLRFDAGSRPDWSIIQDLLNFLSRAVCSRTAYDEVSIVGGSSRSRPCGPGRGGRERELPPTAGGPCVR